MTDQHATPSITNSSTTQNKTRVSQQLSTTSWALFFIWVGISLLADLSWAWALTGIGAIMLGEQAARWQLKAQLETTSIILGAVFLICGLWQVFNFSFPLAPLLFIAVGAAILWRGFFRPR